MKRKKEKTELAVLYARLAVADPTQTPDRLQHQVDDLIIYCQDRGIIVHGIYKEYAGGASFERPEFKKMMEAISEKEIHPDLLLFTTWDRFSRNGEGMSKMIKKIVARGVKPMAIKQRNDSEAFLSILSKAWK